MKKIILFLLTITLLSCDSDNLSNSKAEKIISKCLEQKPQQRQERLTIGKATFRDKDYDIELLQKYMQLKDKGYIEMELIKEITKGYRKGSKEYSIKLTNKALEYIIESTEVSVIVKTFKYEVGEVLEVQEFPAANTAKAKVKFEATNITPFAILSRKDPTEFWIKDFNLTKTSNGWKYCDNF
jgi:hypothetical protein